jgi:cytochrome P450
LAEFSRDIATGLRQLHRTHGPIAALDDHGQRVVFLFHPEYNRQVLSDATTYQARFFGIRGPKRSSQRRVTCGLLAMNGQQHRRNRRLVKEPSNSSRARCSASGRWARSVTSIAK